MYTHAEHPGTSTTTTHTYTTSQPPHSTGCNTCPFQHPHISNTLVAARTHCSSCTPQSVLDLVSVYSLHLMHTPVAKAAQNSISEEEGSEVEDVMYPMAEDQEALLTMFGRNRSFPMVTIPVSALKERAQPGEGQRTRMSSVNFAYVLFVYCGHNAENLVT